MSAPNPEKWNATDEEIGKIAIIDLTTGDATEEVNKVIARVARRRALEELVAMARAICPGCAATPVTACHFSNIITACPSGRIWDRIATIEAEERGGAAV